MREREIVQRDRERLFVADRAEQLHRALVALARLLDLAKQERQRAHIDLDASAQRRGHGELRRDRVRCARLREDPALAEHGARAVLDCRAQLVVAELDRRGARALVELERIVEPPLSPGHAAKAEEALRCGRGDLARREPPIGHDRRRQIAALLRLVALGQRCRVIGHTASLGARVCTRGSV